MLESRLGFMALFLERLSLVPFEPLDSVAGKFLTFKMAFLLPITFLKRVVDFRCCQSPLPV